MYATKDCVPFSTFFGKDKRETKALRKLFIENNKTYPYPKER